MEVLMEIFLDLKLVASFMIPSVICSGESSFKLFIPHKPITFLMLLLTGILRAYYRTC